MAPHSLVATFRSENIKSHEFKSESVCMSAYFHSENSKMVLVHLAFGYLS